MSGGIDGDTIYYDDKYGAWHLGPVERTKESISLVIEEGLTVPIIREGKPVLGADSPEVAKSVTETFLNFVRRFG